MDDGEVGRYWDGNADVWCHDVRAGYDVFRTEFNNPAFVQFLGGSLAGLEVLDAGCGEGYNTRIFATMCGSITGVDISERMIAHARAEEERERRGVLYLVASMNALSPLPDASFDAVVSTMALMDCADYPGAIGEFARVLRPGGLLAFSILHPCFIYGDGPRWVLGEDGAVTGVRLESYYDQAEEVEQWHFSARPDPAAVEPFSVPRFGRRLEEYLNPLAEAGFTLTRVAEPRPTEEACARWPGFRKHRLIPMWLYVECTKGRSGGVM
jgi:ubiquinone/menaquinone biosynthesis C-methylase UbiE